MAKKKRAIVKKRIEVGEVDPDTEGGLVKSNVKAMDKVLAGGSEVIVEQAEDEVKERLDIEKSREELDEDLDKLDEEEDFEVHEVGGEWEEGALDEIEEVVKEPPQFTNPVEVWEKKVYWVKAKNRMDVDAALKMLLASQDTIESITPLKGITYEVEVLVFRLRDGF